jgi:hypothetical protein
MIQVVTNPKYVRKSVEKVGRVVQAKQHDKHGRQRDTIAEKSERVALRDG